MAVLVSTIASNSKLRRGVLSNWGLLQIPHPGFVVLDTPLNAMKQRKGSRQEHIDRKDDIDPRIEPSFWRSLAKLDLNMQVIIFENKEPDESLKEQLNVQLFAGETASAEERIGFIPV